MGCAWDRERRAALRRLRALGVERPQLVAERSRGGWCVWVVARGAITRWHVGPARGRRRARKWLSMRAPSKPLAWTWGASGRAALRAAVEVVAEARR